jgi:hypothetical protein
MRVYKNVLKVRKWYEIFAQFCPMYKYTEEFPAVLHPSV